MDEELLAEIKRFKEQSPDLLDYSNPIAIQALVDVLHMKQLDEKYGIKN